MTEEKIIIDGENAVLGRLASYAAKQALLGKKVIIVNAEKVIITGNKEDIVNRYIIIRAKGNSGFHGPFYPSVTERILKRTIRGMMKYKRGRAGELWKEIRCYNKVPKELEHEKMIKSKRGKTGVTLGYISKMLRGGK